MTEPTRAQDEAELELMEILSPLLENLVLSNAAINAQHVSCPYCFAEMLFASLAVKYALHNRPLCSSDEEFIAKASAIYTLTLRDTLAHAQAQNDNTSDPIPTHRGPSTPQ